MKPWHPTSTALLLVVVLALTVAAIVVASVAGARRAKMTPPQIRVLAGALPLGIVAWLTISAAVASSGALQAFEARPPRLPMLPLSALVLSVALSSTKGFRRILSALPQDWPLALQTFRVGIELVLYLLFLDGLVPRQMTLEGGNVDVLVGLTAPVVALAARRAWVGRRWLLLWNVAGLASLANIVSTTLRGLPGPLHAHTMSVAPVIITVVPYVWIPAFAVPLAVLGHVVSSRRLLAGARAPSASSTPYAA